MKVNLALSGLPGSPPCPSRGASTRPPSTCCRSRRRGSVLTAVRAAFGPAAAGRLSPLPPIEWYLHSLVDPSLRTPRPALLGVLRPGRAARARRLDLGPREGRVRDEAAREARAPRAGPRRAWWSDVQR